MLLKYERLPNFCYWCGRVNHGEKDCEVWLQGKGKLKKENQQYGAWLCAELLRQNRKSVVVISRSARGLPLWIKGPLKPHKKSSTTEVNDLIVKDRDGRYFQSSVCTTCEVTLSPFGPNLSAALGLNLAWKG